MDIIITTHKRCLSQGNIFIGVCQEFCSRGGVGTIYFVAVHDGVCNYSDNHLRSGLSFTSILLKCAIINKIL